MGKLHHILPKIVSAGNSIFLYKVCDTIKIMSLQVACQNKNNFAHVSIIFPHMVLFDVTVAVILN